jgi:hypothetical protein
MVKVFQAIKDDVLETVLIVKLCFTSFWFWLPILYGGYVVLQIWLLVAVHPLTILILPAIISTFLVITREKRMKAQYGIDDGKPKRSLTPFSLTTRERASSSWDVEKALEEYKKMMKDQEEDRS